MFYFAISRSSFLLCRETNVQRKYQYRNKTSNYNHIVIAVAMPNHRMKNVPVNVPIAAPRCGVQPVVYHWNSLSHQSARHAPRQRPKLSYHRSDASDFANGRPTGVYPGVPPSPRSPEFANHLIFQPLSEPQRIIRSTSANSLHVLEQIVERQDRVRKQMRDTITGWKVVAKHIPKPGKNISVNDQMKRIRGLCKDIEQHLGKWKVRVNNIILKP